MTLKTGQYGPFWSCGQKDQYGNWCKFRSDVPVPQPGTTGGQPVQATQGYQAPRPAYPQRQAAGPRTIGKPIEERASIERQASVKAAAEIAAAGHIQPSEVLQYAASFTHFIQSGQLPQVEPEIQIDMNDSDPGPQGEYPA